MSNVWKLKKFDNSIRFEGSKEVLSQKYFLGGNDVSQSETSWQQGPGLG